MKKDSNLQILISQDSDVGKYERRFYEDRLAVKNIVTRSGMHMTLAVISDGIGGENAGERAAEMTITGVLKYFEESNETDILGMLNTALIQVNKNVFREAHTANSKRNMGATAAVAAIHNNRLYIANVGDSRIYLIKGNTITQISNDHSWANEVIRSGKLTSAEAFRHPRKDELVRSIGYESSLKVDLGLYFDGINESEDTAISRQGFLLNPGDKVVLCSDGLTKEIRGQSGHYVEPKEIMSIIADSSPVQSASKLVKKALDRKTNDNVSAIVLEVPGGRPILPVKKLIKFGVPSLAALAVIALIFIINANKQKVIEIYVPTLPPIEFGQILVTNKLNLELSADNNGKLINNIREGDFLDLVIGTIITSSAEEGYARLGFPNQSSVFLANNTEIQLTGDEDTINNLQIDRGRLIVQIPEKNAEKSQVEVISPNNDSVMIKGSVMGVSYDPLTGIFYIDCLSGDCYYLESNNWTKFGAGTHVMFNYGTFQEVSAGIRNELWQFVPNMIATPTMTHTITATSTPTKTPKIVFNTKTPTLTQTNIPSARKSPTITYTATKIPSAPQCSNGKDDDKDGKIDLKDPDCSGPEDESEFPDTATPTHTHTSTPIPPTTTYTLEPTSTYTTEPLPQCSNGIDDDGDDLIDHPADPGCQNPNDNSEDSDNPSNGNNERLPLPTILFLLKLFGLSVK